MVLVALELIRIGTVALSSPSTVVMLLAVLVAWQELVALVRLRMLVVSAGQLRSDTVVPVVVLRAVLMVLARQVVVARLSWSAVMVVVVPMLAALVETRQVARG